MYAKTLELLNKVRTVQRRFGVPVANIGQIPFKEITAGDVLTNVENITAELGKIKSQVGLGAEELLNNTDGFWLSLRSLDPINFANGPLTPAEEEGLQFVMDNPDEAFYTEERDLSGRQALVAVYADVASVQACVSCHNGHPKSPKSDFELGDVMGGVVIRLFVDR